MILCFIPFGVVHFQRAGSYVELFAEIPDRSLAVNAIIPFYFNGLWEEIYYRGLILTLLLTRLRPWVAIVVSSLIFTLSHYELTLSAGEMAFSEFAGPMMSNFGLGLVTAYVFWRTGSIWPGVVFHGLCSGSIFFAAYVVRCW